MLTNRNPHRARVDAWLGIAAGTVAAAAGLTSGTPGGWAVGGAGALAGGAIALRRTAEFSQGRRLELGAESVMDMAQLAALQWILKPQTVAAQLQQEPEPGPLPPSQWWGDVIRYPTVLVYGQFGSGKTTLARQVVDARLALGHQVIVCDPHMAAGAWSGCDRVGAGMDYRAVDDALTRFAQEVESRYKTLAVNASADFTPITYVCDEFTHWADRTKHAADFFAATMADTRKVKMFALFISHGRTLSCLGGKAGLAKTRDDSLLEVQLFAKPDPNAPTGVSPTGLGELKRPGQEPIAVAIPAPGTSAPPAIAPASPTATATESPADFLSRCFDQTITVDHETIATDSLPPEGQAILDWLRDRGGETVKLRDVQRAGLPALKGMNSEAILIRLRALSEGGYLKLWNDGQGWRIRAA